MEDYTGGPRATRMPFLAYFFSADARGATKTYLGGQLAQSVFTSLSGFNTSKGSLAYRSQHVSNHSQSYIRPGSSGARKGDTGSDDTKSYEHQQGKATIPPQHTRG
ncbi:hypothetical protein VOLCADRAFT_93471 [Volvox carteri f. nagariensis]|uniref:Uncharacterized protein n=1 Tax=Volvox carteri f. nagariensis TaxID=3068 RepID=D8U275_VOLCA|nr:uncharacterized protein VOLCADRAFT_93471 [Volvox carteri f. nagariensis]XP_002959483.1 uncharacterized protein VOLCADRAFT_100953 [Volvox carteri f. nagariensis]EFJ39452.1 hypothetical protein VOLCADRAFT_100953 [Volvox carteri f. nagariensis]EFJ46317.1 hypothetical protein VOLCADRAFT_93471 [Volvox carteri f. nagariensis]|eukprot:XP_002952764.1 hypothetical protein VOLCADRAFT_93471 [Volvox carteri f. nagariensis]